MEWESERVSEWKGTVELIKLDGIKMSSFCLFGAKCEWRTRALKRCYCCCCCWCSRWELFQHTMLMMCTSHVVIYLFIYSFTFLLGLSPSPSSIPSAVDVLLIMDKVSQYNNVNTLPFNTQIQTLCKRRAIQSENCLERETWCVFNTTKIESWVCVWMKIKHKKNSQKIFEEWTNKRKRTRKEWKKRMKGNLQRMAMWS